MRLNELFLKSADNGQKIQEIIEPLVPKLLDISERALNNDVSEEEIILAKESVREIKKLLYDLQLGLSYVTANLSIIKTHAKRKEAAC